MARGHGSRRTRCARAPHHEVSGWARSLPRPQATNTDLVLGSVRAKSVPHNSSHAHASRRMAAEWLVAMVRDARAARGLLTMRSVGGRDLSLGLKPQTQTSSWGACVRRAYRTTALTRTRLEGWPQNGSWPWFETHALRAGSSP